MSHKKRKVIVTGASGGIGNELIRLMLANGYTHIVGVFNRTLAEIPGAAMFAADLMELEDVQALSQRHGDAWAVINLAGASHPAASFKEPNITATIKAIDDNTMTTVLMGTLFSGAMRDRGEGGRIINTSSVVAHRPVFGASAYATAKAAVEGYTKALAWEVGNKSITANTIALGYFNAGMGLKIESQECEAIINEQAIERFGTVSELYGLIDYLVSDAGAFMTAQTLHLNGGLR